MKKLVLSVFLCLLVLCLTLPCFASFPAYDHYRVDNAAYLAIIKNNPPPEDFVPYDRVAFLGKMENFSTNTDYQRGYSYTIVAENAQKIYLYFNHAPMSDVIYIGTEYFRAQHIVDLKDEDSMLELDLEELVGRTGYEIELGDKIYIDTGELRYWYDSRGALSAIVVYYNGSYCWIVSDFFEVDADSWMGRLVSREKSGKAATEIKARFAGLYHEHREQPLAICLSAIGGAVVAGVGAWLITFLVMRKKRGAPMPAMSGAPAGDVLAGSDGDASAVPSGAAPTPPDN